MKTKLSKTQAQEQIGNFFKNIKDKNPKEIKKIKRLAMSYNIKLKKKRKTFCKKCYSPKLNTKSIKNKIKVVLCGGCGHVSRWKIN